MVTFSAKILDDVIVDFYLELKKNEVDKTKFTLCLDINEERISMIVEGNYMLSIKFRQPNCEIHFPNTGPIENHPEMP